MWGDVATWVGIVAAGAIGAWGVLVSRRAAASSAEAAEIAREAHSLQLESRHVTWSHRWFDQLDVMRLRNTGTDDAHQVLFWADFEDVAERYTAAAELVTPLDHLDMDVKDAVAFLRERAAAAQARETKGYSHRPQLRVAAWGVRWESAAGVPSSQVLAGFWTTL